MYVCVCCSSFSLGHEAHSASSLGRASNQGRISISIWSSLSGNNLNFCATLLLAFHAPALYMKEVLKWANYIVLRYGMLCADNRGFLVLSLQEFKEGC